MKFGIDTNFIFDGVAALRAGDLRFLPMGAGEYKERIFEAGEIKTALNNA